MEPNQNNHSTPATRPTAERERCGSNAGEHHEPPQAAVSKNREKKRRQKQNKKLRRQQRGTAPTGEQRNEHDRLVASRGSTEHKIATTTSSASAHDLTAALQHTFPEAQDFLIRRQLEFCGMMHAVAVGLGQCLDPVEGWTMDELFDSETEGEFEIPVWWKERPDEVGAGLRNEGADEVGAAARRETTGDRKPSVDGGHFDHPAHIALDRLTHAASPRAATPHASDLV